MKILLVYCNLFQEPLVPLGVSMLISTLRKSEHQVDLFDTTFYKKLDSDQKDRIESGQVAAYSDTVFPVYDYDDMPGDFIGRLVQFNPDLVGFSCTENTYKVAVELATLCRGFTTIIGGPFATFYSGRFPKVFDHIWKGEGERLLPQFTKYYETDYLSHYTMGGGLCSLDELPSPDFSLWHKKRYLRPMSGKMYRMFPVEIGRGCPYRCKYCSAPAYEKMFPGWRRIKSVSAIMRDIHTLMEKYDPEYLYFVSETFLAMPNNWRREFYDRYYEECRLPFWMNTRPEQINKTDVYELARCRCHRISLGVEHGNGAFRKNVLGRNYTNKKIIDACKMIKDAGIQLSVNNMVGFPDETEKLIWDTVLLNRKLEADSHTVSVFQPYWGTGLREVCVKKGYIPNDFICSGYRFAEPVLNMPQLDNRMIKTYYNNFNKWVGEKESKYAIISNSG